MSQDLGFVGTQIDRADYLRGDTEALEKGRKSAKSIVFWRSRPLLDFQMQGLVFVEIDHPMLENPHLQIFLGLESGSHIYATDISSWAPDEMPETSGNPLFDQSIVEHPLAPDGSIFTDARFAMGALQAEYAEWAASAKALFHWHNAHMFCAKCGEPSELAKAGWQRNCPSCKTPHFPRTDPSVIMLITYGNKLLLGRSPGWPERMYSCLAGFMEPGETIEMAVRREVMEEAGIKVGRVRYLLSQPWPYPSSLMLGCIGEALDNELDVDPVELEDAIWISREELIAAKNMEKPSVIPARPGSIAYVLIEAWLKDTVNDLNDIF